MLRSLENKRRNGSGSAGGGDCGSPGRRDGPGRGSGGTDGEFGVFTPSLKKERSLELGRQTQGMREKIQEPFDIGIVKICTHRQFLLNC